MAVVRRSFRTRLLVAFVALALGVLAVAGSATYLLTRTTARQDAIDTLQKKSDNLQEGVRAVIAAFVGAEADREPVNRVRAIAQAMNVFGARVVFVRGNAIVSGDETVLARRFTDPAVAQAFSVPDVLSNRLDLLPVDRLTAGDTVTGSVGSTAFLARVDPQLSLRATALPKVVILTAAIKTNVVGRAGPYFLLAAGVTLLIAAAVAFWLARRLTAPLRDIQHSARRLASGDLTSRVPVDERAGDEVVSLATTLNAMASQLEDARGSERAFLLSISHDLRTPLTSIRGYAEALADGTLDDRDPEARKRAAAVIQAEARRLERLVRDLLDLSRLDSHQFSLHPRPCDAAEVVTEAAHGFEPAARDMGVTLRVAHNGPAPADLDADRLAQIVANLVENALKYAAASVDVSLTSADHALTIAVHDDGPGVPAADLPHVFERLYTGRGGNGRAVGTGLGLAIVRELTHAMGGDVRAEANETGGARFVVHLPPVRR